MIPILLLHKILQLFVIMLFGFVLVKANVLKSKDSLALSKLSLYLFMPAVIINAFNMELTPDIMAGLALSFGVAIVIHMAFFGLDFLFRKLFHTTCVERASIMYSNAGNLIVPIVTYVFGSEWVIYSCGYLIVQIIFLWTHGIALFSEDKKPSWKKIILNVNVIAVAVGFTLLFSGIRLPDFAGEIVSSLGGMLAPSGMIIAGMLAASINFKQMLRVKRLYLVAVLRLVICPVIMMLLMKVIFAFVTITNAHTIMLISYFASITPQASTVMQFAQIHGKDAEYATVINVVTTLACVITMPILILFF